MKDESRRKMKELCVRLTESDMETVRRNCRIAGYGSVSRFVRARLTYETPRKAAPQADREAAPAGSVPEWLRDETGRLSRQIRGVAANYNQAVSVMNTLVKSVEGRETQRLIIRRAARLDTLTRELVDTLQEMKRVVGIAAGEAGMKEADGAAVQDNDGR